MNPRRLKVIEHLEAYQANSLDWASLGGGSISLPYLEQEAFGEIDERFRFYGFVDDPEFIHTSSTAREAERAGRADGSGAGRSSGSHEPPEAQVGSQPPLPAWSGGVNPPR